MCRLYALAWAGTHSTHQPQPVRDLEEVKPQ